MSALSCSLHLFDGTKIPYEIIKVGASKKRAIDGEPKEPPKSRNLLVFGHGLQGVMSSSRDRDCIPALEALPESKNAPDLVVYDARGHGESSGWQNLGPEQFHWRCLAVDMIEVAAAADQRRLDTGGDPTTAAAAGGACAVGAASNSGYILGGCSMGAASAIWAALLSPRSVKGLVLFKVPTMWEVRRGRRATLEANAKKESNADFAQVLLGAARANLPDEDELSQINVPVLIVGSRDDPIHPQSSLEALKEIWGSRATTLLMDTKAEASKAFHRGLPDWLIEHGFC
eukprot:TRINITY_DN2869_c0_g2_i1.p1 TRINITY_DN2869_c0_g2~~TRINITY_DN2869_c0_g2_i1.p1  ORF type:complete len:287 (+),score=54.04 TRINITY_DN2869_c0_g2_i1:134-994(+)